MKFDEDSYDSAYLHKKTLNLECVVFLSPHQGNPTSNHNQYDTSQLFCELCHSLPSAYSKAYQCIWHHISSA